MPDWRICRITGDARASEASAADSDGRGVAASRRRPTTATPTLHAGFRWPVPARFNIAEACCARWAGDTPDAVAIRWEHEDGQRGDATPTPICSAPRTGSPTRCAGSASRAATASRS